MIQSEKGTMWIKNLVQLEKTISTNTTPSNPNKDIKPSQKILEEHTFEFIQQLRTAFTASSAVFNYMKDFVGSLKIYGVANTKADFMVFRNGHKIIFSTKKPGVILVHLRLNNNLKSSSKDPIDFIQSEWGAFNELQWYHKGQIINIDYLIRYYMSIFVKYSIK